MYTRKEKPAETIVHDPYDVNNNVKLRGLSGFRAFAELYDVEIKQLIDVLDETISNYLGKLSYNSVQISHVGSSKMVFWLFINTPHVSQDVGNFTHRAIGSNRIQNFRKDIFVGFRRGP